MKPNYNQKDLVGGYKKQPFPFFFFLYNNQAYPIKHTIPFQKKRKENRIAWKLKTGEQDLELQRLTYN